MGNEIGLWKEQDVEADASIVILREGRAGVWKDYIEAVLHSQHYQMAMSLSTDGADELSTKILTAPARSGAMPGRAMLCRGLARV